MTDQAPPEIPIELAATVLVLRDTPHGIEVLLMRRASELAFHGGAWVFPGGRVEASDAVDDDALETARRAAVRETLEEANVVLEPSALVPVSHWTTPRGRPRRFATWFFATALQGEVDVVVDGGEIKTHRWLRPAEALEARGRGELDLPPPTFVTLTVLDAFPDTESFFAHLREGEPPMFEPRLRVTPAGPLALYHGDVAYEAGELDAPGPRHRLHMPQSGWRYERS